jgi:hypothetical protein
LRPKLVLTWGNEIFSHLRNWVFCGGIFHTIQWVKVPIGASGSSMIIARLFVSFGMPEIPRGGKRSEPSQVYSEGIMDSFSNAGLEIFTVSTRIPLYNIHCDDYQV